MPVFLVCSVSSIRESSAAAMFQMRRDGSEHLQQHYMLAVGLHAVEMLGIPLCGAQSHSVERSESIKDLGHMDTPKQHQQHTERNISICSWGLKEESVPLPIGNGFKISLDR